MHIIDDSDNKYQEGAIVRLKTDPSARLVIVKYQQRIYFCADPRAPLGKQTPYFEREIVGIETL